MNKKVKAILGVAIFAVLIAAAAFAYGRLSDIAPAPDNLAPIVPDNPEQTSPDDPAEYERPEAPDFTMLDQDGNEVRLSDFFGKPVVLNFWATWCPSCVQESPYFESIYREMGGEIHIVKVNLLDGQRETRAEVDRFMADNEYTFPIYFDVTGEAAGAYGIHFIPVTFFIDADGRLAARAQGAVDEQALRDGIDMARD